MTNNTEQNKIDSLFCKKNLDAEAARISAIKEQIKTGIFLLGAGNTGKYIATQNNGVDFPKIIGFIDDTPGKAGTKVENIPVFTREVALDTYGANVPVVVCIFKAGFFFNNIKESVISSGFANVLSLPDYIRATNHLIPFYYFSKTSVLKQHQQEIASLYESLADEKSRVVLKRWLHFRLYHDYNNMDHYDPDIYFPDFLPGQSQEHFCMADCGAYDGDSIARLLEWRTSSPTHAIAFEPDKSNISRLKTRLRANCKNGTLKLKLIAAAVGEKSGFVNFMETNDESAHVVSEGGRRVPVLSVEEGCNDMIPDYVKYDVEGYEKQALEGTKNLISGHAPALAISIYHRPEDLWELPETILTWAPKYKLYLRSHAEEGMDTVLYAIRT